MRFLQSALHCTNSSKRACRQSRSARSRHTDGYFPLFTVAWLVQYYLLHGPQSKLILWSIEARSLKFVPSVSSCYKQSYAHALLTYQPVVSSAPGWHLPAPAALHTLELRVTDIVGNIAITFPWTDVYEFNQSHSLNFQRHLFVSKYSKNCTIVNIIFIYNNSSI